MVAQRVIFNLSLETGIIDCKRAIKNKLQYILLKSALTSFFLKVFLFTPLKIAQTLLGLDFLDRFLWSSLSFPQNKIRNIPDM